MISIVGNFLSRLSLNTAHVPLQACMRIFHGLFHGNSFSTATTLELSESTKQALRQLKQDGPLYYSKITIKGRQFTVSQHDVIVTHRLKATNIGDTLRLTQIRELGSRFCTLKGSPFIDPRYCIIRAQVIEHGRGMKIHAKEGRKRKGRSRRKRTIKPAISKIKILEISPIVYQ